MVLAGALLLATAPAQAQRESEIKFVSPQAALDQGIGAFRGGFYQHALPALQYAADKGLLLAQYHLALLYADNASANTDHVKAYKLFRQIVDKHANKIDVDDDELAPYVGRSLTAVARYYLRGLPEYNLAPNAALAAQNLQVADTFFRDPDARFELAKMYLKGEGVQENHRQALGRLTALTQDGHAGATAFFADLLWRGTVVKKDEVQALVLIRWAVENAPASERIWIEDIYRSIYCGAGAGIRKQADGQIAGFSRAFTPRPPTDAGERLGLGIGPKHSCESGETLPEIPVREGRPAHAGTTTRNAGSMSQPVTPPSGTVMDIRGQMSAPSPR